MPKIPNTKKIPKYQKIDKMPKIPNKKLQYIYINQSNKNFLKKEHVI